MPDGGKQRVRAAIAAAAPARPALVRDLVATRFEMRTDGLWRLPRKDSEVEFWVCENFEAVAETRDAASSAWGLILTWLDRDGRPHESAVPRYMIAGEGNEVRARLADGGLTMAAGRGAREALVEYLNCVRPRARAQCVPTIGWHMAGDVRVFVLPGRTFGDTADRVIFQPPEPAADPFHCGGTLAEWRVHVAALCVGNSRLAFAVSVAFAGPLLDLIGESGGGFNFRGQSRVGKSTALRLAASVWGGQSSRGADGYINTWRATDNALESVAACRSDTFLALDEMGQVDARAAGEIAYLLASGAGKTRARRDGIARAPLHFRVLFLSTGEVGLAEKSAEAGNVTRAGQEVRFVDIAADAGAGLGMFESLHGTDSPGAFAEGLGAATARFYGTAAVAFLEKLVAQVNGGGAEFIDALRAEVATLAAEMIGGASDAAGQVRSVARRFAIVAVAGEFASQAKITGWAPGEATQAARACFVAWLADRGHAGAREDVEAVTRLRDFIAAHGDSRFEVWGEDPASAGRQAEDSMPPASRFRTVARAGWKRWPRGGDERAVWHHYLTPAGMKEALKGLDFKSALQTLVRAGHLVPDGAGRSSRVFAVPGNGRARLYEVCPDILAVDP